MRLRSKIQTPKNKRRNQTLKSAFQIRRLVSFSLMIVLTANPILAMPQGVLAVGNEVSYSLAFHWYNSGWSCG